MSRNTVRRVRDEGAGRHYQRGVRTSKLDAFVEYIRERLAAAAPGRIPASVVLREIRARGYAGSHSILRAHMATLRTVRVEESVVRFETPAGRQMQVDWAEFRVDGLCWFAFVVVLGFSRWIFGRFVEDQRFETLRDLHVATFEALGVVLREVQRKLSTASTESRTSLARLSVLMERAERVCTQQRKDKHGLYALHAPEVECIGKGKARQRYEFGVKTSIAVTHRSGLMVGARSFPGNPYDGHTLAPQLEQTRILLEDFGAKPKQVVVDLGYRSANGFAPAG